MEDKKTCGCGCQHEKTEKLNNCGCKRNNKANPKR